MWKPRRAKAFARPLRYAFALRALECRPFVAAGRKRVLRAPVGQLKVYITHSIQSEPASLSVALSLAERPVEAGLSHFWQNELVALSD